MSHVKSSAVQGGGGRGVAAPPEDRQLSMQVEQMQVYKQCQFILKPRPVEPPRQHVPAGETFFPTLTPCRNEENCPHALWNVADFSQKSFRRRRSLITWAFWRGSTSHLNELSAAGAAPGCLFGRPLSSICVEDALPKPLMVSGDELMLVRQCTL